MTKPAPEGQQLALVASPDAPPEERNEGATLLAGQIGVRLPPQELEDFSWDLTKNPDIVMPEQRSLAVYSNTQGAVVIRQEKRWPDEDEDNIFTILPAHIDAFVERLMRAKAEAELTGRELASAAGE